MNDEMMERLYKERLDERILSYLSESENLALDDAMRIYYSSKLADKIYRGDYGLQYLDHKVLVEYLKFLLH